MGFFEAGIVSNFLQGDPAGKPKTRMASLGSMVVHTKIRQVVRNRMHYDTDTMIGLAT